MNGKSISAIIKKKSWADIHYLRSMLLEARSIPCFDRSTWLLQSGWSCFYLCIAPSRTLKLGLGICKKLMLQRQGQRMHTGCSSLAHDIR